MRFLLHLKHWQLFLLVIGIPFIAEIFVIVNTLSGERPGPPNTVIASPLVLIPFTFLLFSWFYALGTRLHSKLPESVKMNLAKFKFFILIAVLYMLLIGILFFKLPFQIQGAEIRFDNIFLYLIPVHLFAMFCIIYCFYFIAKTLKAVELQRPVKFDDFAGEFFLLWFYYIGIWIIQPRINRLFRVDGQ
jgi:bacteriorhodopsin